MTYLMRAWMLISVYVITLFGNIFMTSERGTFFTVFLFLNMLIFMGLGYMYGLTMYSDLENRYFKHFCVGIAGGVCINLGYNFMSRYTVCILSVLLLLYIIQIIQTINTCSCIDEDKSMPDS